MKITSSYFNNTTNIQYNMDSVIINNIEVTKDEAVKFMADAIKTASNNGYAPGHRVEDIYGYFWEALEQKTNSKLTYSDITSVTKMFDANKMIFA